MCRERTLVRGLTLRISSLETTVPFDEVQWIHTTVRLLFLVSSPHRKELAVKVSIPATRAPRTILTWETDIHRSRSHFHPSFSISLQPQMKNVLVLCSSDSFSEGFFYRTHARGLLLKLQNQPLPQSQSDIALPTPYLLLLWKCVVFIPKRLSYPPAIWLLASLLWKQLKNQEASS